ncbi:winged helix-turn-helix domain-containing protein [Niabella pedocola]|uniref:Winged helix-turn-helix domain-containing protein n=1 Tax=Niabella pedocola TaxID=1752077 RepID=A0ABS8PUQ0_9BACT|nr:winged helix-turn-helix domain-containing protein [Niabella pedocola]MCD2423636.1 winged helix-turn-helix domain-containing protein [Niabella pedocola]
MVATKKELYQDMVTFYGNLYGLPPLNAKIYVYMMIDLKTDGYTFDELLEKFNVSKSSLSNSLQMLVQNKYVEYITPIDSRKRYYRINPKFMGIRFGNILDKLVREKELMQRMVQCNKQVKNPNEQVIKGINQYITILDKHIKTVESTVKSLHQ